VAVEETPDTIYLVLPSTPMAGGEGGALSDQQLESVAGGVVVGDYTGVGHTCEVAPECMEVIDE
jgi:hypothetical protein